MLVTRMKVLNLVSLLVMKQPSGENVLLFNNCPTPPRGTPEARGKGGVSGLMVQILSHKSTYIHTLLVSAFERNANIPWNQIRDCHSLPLTRQEKYFHSFT